jgi:hypothetical protein
MRRYIVIGTHNGERVREEVEASNPRQAKLRGGFMAGFGGYELSSFMKSSKIKVKKA